MNNNIQSLDKKWKEFLFAMGGFGPNFMAVLMGAYFSDAVNPAALTEGSVQAISGVCLVLPAVFPVLWFIARVIDGLIDIPLASITDSLTTRFGRRRPPILVCFIPMVLSFAMCWFPVGGYGVDCNRVVNTVWMCAWAVVFFVSYSMSIITFYGAIASVTTSESQRSRVTAFKSFFDTISYCIVYALVPLLLKVMDVHINVLVWIMLPMFITILIPVFLIKEGAKYGYPENRGKDATQYKRVGLGQSLKITFSNRVFLKWIIVDCCAIFGLQMFLVSMNTLIIGGMGFDGGQMAVINTSAFAPIPVMLYLLNKLKRRKGLRFAFQTCLLSFAVCILSFDVASLYILGADRVGLQYLIAIAGGLCASWAIGAFFMFPYLVPAQVGGVEKQITGIDRSSMYFAARIVCTTIVGAFGSSLVYDNIKNLFISKSASGVVYATGFGEAASEFTANTGTVITSSEVFNLGLLLVPIIVCLACIAGFFAAFALPGDFSAELIAAALKKQHPEYDISSISDIEEKEDDTENVVIMNALWLLSGSFFGMIWLGIAANKFRKISDTKRQIVLGIVSCIIPFVGIAYLLRLHKEMNICLEATGLQAKNRIPVYVISGILLPLVFVNPVALSLIQHDLNRILRIKVAA
ncbi:MAG: MFS transporter [Lachnospiraceae bacterium]|jgi:GPH family glycoside/pentoside/hexuronide:cation symporter